MVWGFMKNRRQTPSPSSTDSSSRGKRSSFFRPRNKRRSSDVADSTESMDLEITISKEDSAAWRVENIRTSPPTEEEWWTEPCESNDSQDYSDGEGLEVAAAANVSLSSSTSETRQFHNCGLETWLRAREEWTKRTVETLPKKLPPGEYSAVARGLRKNMSLRTYELPQKMALPDIIELYTEIWDGKGI